VNLHRASAGKHIIRGRPSRNESNHGPIKAIPIITPNVAPRFAAREAKRWPAASKTLNLSVHPCESFVTVPACEQESAELLEVQAAGCTLSKYSCR
jgi:hypothetical protein